MVILLITEKEVTKKIFNLFASIAICFTHYLCASGTPTQKAMIQDLEVVKYQITSKYAPTEWKRQHLGWNLEDAFKDAKNRILNENAQTSKDYQNILSQFLKSARDYHVHLSLVSTSSSLFPITIKGIDGRYFITAFFELPNMEWSFSDLMFEAEPFDGEQMKKEIERTNIQAGDEILTFNGKPIREEIENIIDNFLDGDRTPTGYALAERMLFLRKGSRGHETPSGTFEITIRHNKEEDIHTLQLPWIHVAERINNELIHAMYIPALNPLKWFQREDERTKLHKALDRLAGKDFSVEVARDVLTPIFKKNLTKMKRGGEKGIDKRVEKVSDSDSGEESDTPTDWRDKGFLPPLGRIIWESDIDDDIYAYLFENAEGKRIGYLYIESFMFVNLDEIIEALKYLKTHSEALVVDITNNAGGSATEMFAILAMLTDHPLKALKQREILIQDDILDASITYESGERLLKELEREEDEEVDEGEVDEGNGKPTFGGYPLTAQLIEKLRNACKEIIDTWNSGQRMTKPAYILGIDLIEPHPEVQYDKPILVLINELDFSCADLFPAIIQDNGRAMLFGKKTSGAGGYVRAYSHASQFGVAGYSLTGSIVYRLNGEPIENLGVTPDIPYELTENDMRKNYSDYIRAVNDAIKNLLTK